MRTCERAAVKHSSLRVAPTRHDSILRGRSLGLAASSDADHHATLRRPQPHTGAALPRARHQTRSAPAARSATRRSRAEAPPRCFAGHKNEVLSGGGPDGRVITGSRDATVKLWRDGACGERTIEAHVHNVRAVAVLPGGARFLRLARRHREAVDARRHLERTFEVGSVVLCVAALPDGVHFVVGLGLGGTSGCTTSTGRASTTSCGPRAPHGHTVRAVAATPDGQHIVSGSFDKSIKVWSVASKSLVSDCDGHTGAIHAVAATPDGQRILSGGEDSVRVWLCGTLVNTFWLHRYRVNACGAARQPARALRLGRQDGQALQRQRRRRRAHLQAPHRPRAPWRCFPTAFASSAARPTAQRASPSTASRSSPIRHGSKRRQSARPRGGRTPTWLG